MTHLTSSIAPARQKAAEQQLVEPFGHRRGRAVGQHRLGAERDGDLEPLAQPLGHAVVLRAALVPLPVHAGRAAVEHLHAVGADVAHAGFGILREHERQRDVAAAVLGPALEDRQLVERAVALRRSPGTARPSPSSASDRAAAPTIGSIFSASMMPSGICGVISSSISVARSSSVFTPSARHMRSRRSEDVGGDRHVEAGGLLEQQRGTAARRLARAVGDGGDLEVGAHRLGDARQQPALVEVGEKVVEVREYIRQ